MEIKESNCLPYSGGGRFANNKRGDLSDVDSLTRSFCQIVNTKVSAKGIVTFWEELKSSRSKVVFFRSQQFDLIVKVSDLFSEQQSLTCVKEILVFPLLKHTILLTVKPKPDSNKTTTKNTDVIF